MDTEKSLQYRYIQLGYILVPRNKYSTTDMTYNA